MSDPSSTDLDRFSNIKALAVGVSIALHLLLVLVFEFSGLVPGDTDSRYHFYALVPISLVLSLASVFTERRNLFLSIWSARVIIVAIFASRYSGSLIMRLPLLASVAVEIALFEDYPGNTIIGGAALLASVMAFVLRDGISVPNGVVNLQALVYSGLLLGVVSRLTNLRERLVRDHARNEALDAIVREVTATNLRLQQLAFMAGEESKSEERERITSEIHDAVGYSLTNLIMMMEAATDLVYDDPERLSRLMQDARRQAASGLDETRKALRLLRQEDPAPQTGVHAYERLFQTFQQASSVAIRAEYGNIPLTFGEVIDGIVYHFIQEGLTNSVMHGMATSILVVFWLSDNELLVTMTDNGRGSEQVAPGIGLSAMQERAARHGGQVTAEGVGHGFELQMRLPVRERNDG